MLKHYGRFCQISSGFLDGCAMSSSIYKFCFSLAKRGFNLFIFSEMLNYHSHIFKYKVFL